MDDGSISLPRVRGVVRLLGDVRDIGVGTEGARQHLVTELCQKLDAMAGAAVLGGPGGIVDATVVTVAANRIIATRDPSEAGDRSPPIARTLLERLTLELRTAGIDDVRLTISTIVASNELRSTGDLERYGTPFELLCTVNPRGHRGIVEGTGFVRPAGHPFTDEDRSVLRLVILESAALFEDQAEITLAPRVEATLECLLTGASDKAIAEQLQISHHTVRQYVKIIFRSFGVSSRSQLIAQVLSRGRKAPTPPARGSRGD
ncbi:Transcriptional regulator, LuxR family protein [Labilithrix luteola]|uniref:Transcriptional regulator, LuxR family protein n=1 Tax=Labilithrix luteola TaxID=1391654 RepID=A0A0K1QEG0_9BACT|nr:helix-turn-helix transcriptional regulator [Labilithrix luteola]AKV04118.1 Transcriptional regulator, LuxR family protein [Labilithrix luteola]